MRRAPAPVVAELLRRFGSAARVQQRTSQKRARMAWRIVSPYLLDETRQRVWIAWGHALGPDGPAELDALIAAFADVATSRAA